MTFGHISLSHLITKIPVTENLPPCFVVDLGDHSENIFRITKIWVFDECSLSLDPLENPHKDDQTYDINSINGRDCQNLTSERIHIKDPKRDKEEVQVSK